MPLKNPFVAKEPAIKGKCFPNLILSYSHFTNTTFLLHGLALTLSHIVPMSSSSQAPAARRTLNRGRVASSLCHIDPQGQSVSPPFIVFLSLVFS